MEEKKVESNGGGVSFLGLLTLIFITLKLTGHINWAWPWVLAPIWLLPVTAITIIIVIASLYFLLDLLVILVRAFKRSGSSKSDTD